MKKYVLIGVIQDEKIIVVERTKDDWQKGKINLIGGHVEDGESPIDAARRKTQEECGIKGGSFYEAGLITNTAKTFECWTYVCHPYTDLSSTKLDGDENCKVVDLNFILSDDRLIENLKIVIPLLRQNMANWTMIDDNVGFVKDCEYTIKFGKVNGCS